LKQSLLPAIAGGEHLTTLAFSEAGSGGHFYMPVSEVTKESHGLHLTAHKTFVTSAGEADSYVVSTRKASASGLRIWIFISSPRARRALMLESPLRAWAWQGTAAHP